MTRNQYNFIWNTINAKVEEARKEWKENKDEETTYIYENQMANAQRALDAFEEWYLGTSF